MRRVRKYMPGLKETVRKDIHGIWMKVWRIPQAGGREA